MVTLTRTADNQERHHDDECTRGFPLSAHVASPFRRDSSRNYLLRGGCRSPAIGVWLVWCVALRVAECSSSRLGTTPVRSLAVEQHRSHGRPMPRSVTQPRRRCSKQEPWQYGAPDRADSRGEPEMYILEGAQRRHGRVAIWLGGLGRLASRHRSMTGHWRSPL
jgi:hypothetical protein